MPGDRQDTFLHWGGVLGLQQQMTVVQLGADFFHLVPEGVGEPEPLNAQFINAY